MQGLPQPAAPFAPGAASAETSVYPAVDAMIDPELQALLSAGLDGGGAGGEEEGASRMNRGGEKSSGPCRASSDSQTRQSSGFRT